MLINDFCKLRINTCEHVGKKTKDFSIRKKLNKIRQQIKLLVGKKGQMMGEVGPDGIHQNYFLMFLIKQVQADRGLRGYFMPCSPT